MRRVLFLLAALLLLPGCEKRAELTYETVDDVFPVCAVVDAPYEISVALPGDAIAISQDATGSFYEASNGDYSIYTKIMVSDSLDAAVYQLSGFAQPQLRVDLEDDAGMACQFAWCSAGEQGETVCRAKVIRRGDYCYALCFSLKEGYGRAYNRCINEVFSSFALRSKSEEAEVFAQDVAEQRAVAHHIPAVIAI